MMQMAGLDDEADMFASVLMPIVASQPYPARYRSRTLNPTTCQNNVVTGSMGGVAGFCHFVAAALTWESTPRWQAA
jgi:hypothetical protein